MPRTLPHTDIVIVGLGWTGSIAAQELAATGLRIVAIERGPWRDTSTDFPVTYAQDELRYGIRYDLFLRPAQETLTFRNNGAQVALPIRNWGSFLPGNGVGGAGVHWNGQTWRFLPTDFTIRSHTEQRYGRGFIPADMTIQDWGVTYDELEPHYEQFEQVCGTSGKAGNLGGVIQPEGNPFEGPRRHEYPTPPQPQTYAPTLFAEAARNAGHQPFPQPSSNLSQAWTNPYAVTLGPCTYCGFCERFGCGNNSKASPQSAVLPALIRHPNVEARTLCEVTRITLDSTGKRATGVIYVDEKGEEWEQPADLMLVCNFSFFAVRLLLLSGIGKPYDPQSGLGVVGRNYAYQVTSAVTAYFDNKRFNSFVASGALGMLIDDYNGDNFDHGPHGFIGGGFMGMAQTNARPITTRPVPPGTPAWGSAWKKATAENYNSAVSPSTHGSCMSYKQNYLDLDPTYKDRHGRPLLRMTFDFQPNDLAMSNFLTDRLAELARAMGPRQISESRRRAPYSVVPYQTTHNVGGAVMGTDPTTSVVNRFMQSWDVPNVFVFGAAVFPQNAGYNPTGTIGALTYWAVDAIKTRYLPNPGRLM